MALIAPRKNALLLNDVVKFYYITLSNFVYSVSHASQNRLIIYRKKIANCY